MTSSIVIYSVWGSASDNIYAAGQQGKMIRWNGTAWSDVNLGATSVGTGKIYGIWGSAADNIYAVADGGILIRWNGTAWADIDLTGTAVGTSDLYCIWGTASDNIYAAGEDNTMIRWNGTAWGNVDLTGTAGTTDIRVIWGTAAGNIYAAKQWGVLIQWNGTAWANVNLGATTLGTNAIHGIWGTGPSDVYAGAYNGKMVHWNGTAWADVDLTATSMGTKLIWAMWGTAADNIYASGTDRRLIRWNGTAWADVDVSATTMASLTDLTTIWGTAADNIYVAGQYGRMVRYASSQPVVTAGNGAVQTFTQGGSAVTVDHLITVSHTQNNFNGGVLQAEVTANKDGTSDVLSANWDVSGSGVPSLGAGQVGIDTDNNNVYYDNTATLVGTVDGTNDGSAGKIWEVDLNANATTAAIQALARKVRFDNTAQTPSTSQRTVTFTVTDAASASGTASKSLNVIAQSTSSSVSVPTDDPDPTAWYADQDSDGYGDPAVFKLSTVKPTGYVAGNGDCNDADPDVHPGAPEVCDDGIDQDCDGYDTRTWYKDKDNDGFGDAGSVMESGLQPAGYVPDGSDCNDNDPKAYPGADEIADDGVDQDCDGVDILTWYWDFDQDGFGKATKTIEAVSQPAGYVLDHSDCNNGDPSIYPGAPETPGDGIDQDCDGMDTPAGFIGTFEAAPSSGLAPVAVSFTTLVAQGVFPFSFLYDFGDGTQPTAGTDQITHTYAAKGNYTAKVTVTDAAGSAVNLWATVAVVDAADLGDLTSQLIASADQVEKTVVPGDLPGILANAEDIIGKSLTALSGTDPGNEAKIRDTIRAEAGTLLANTKEKMAAFIATGELGQGDMGDILNGVGDVVSTMVKNDTAVAKTTLDDLETISKDAFFVSIETLLKDENISPGQLEAIKTDTTEAQAYLAVTPHLLGDVVDTLGIFVDLVTGFQAADIKTVASKMGLDEKQAAGLFNAVAPTPDPEKTIALSQNAVKTIAEIAVEVVDTYYTGKVLSDVTIEAVSKNLLLRFEDNTYISFLIAAVSVVGDFVPQGLFFLPEGGILGIKDAYAIKLVPYPVYPFDFAAKILENGVSLQLTETGAISADLSNTVKLSTGIGWEAFPGNTFNDLNTSFSVLGGNDPGAEAYSLLVTYDTGLSQLIPPAVFALDAFVNVLDTLVPADYSINQDTGVITVGDLKLKPDYSFTAKKSVDFDLIKASGGFVYEQLGFEVKDFNGDGLLDFGLHSDTPMGFQKLYAVFD